MEQEQKVSEVREILQGLIEDAVTKYPPHCSTPLGKNIDLIFDNEVTKAIFAIEQLIQKSREEERGEERKRILTMLDDDKELLYKLGTIDHIGLLDKIRKGK